MAYEQYRRKEQRTVDTYEKYRRKEPTKEKKSLYSLWGAEVTPKMEKEAPYTTATTKTLQEGVGTPLLHFLNMQALNLPRSLAAKYGYEYPEPKTLPGAVLAKTAGVTGLVGSVPLRALLAAGGAGTGILGKGLMGATKGAIAGAAYSPEDLTDIEARKKQAKIGASIGFGTGLVSGAFSGLLRRRGEKVAKIREGMKTWWRKEGNVYRKMLRKITKVDTSDIDPTTSLEYMERELLNKGLIDQTGNKTFRTANKVDKQLYDSYIKLRDMFISTGKEGKVSLQAVLQEGRNIMAKGGKFKAPTLLGKEAARYQRELVGTIKPQIKAGEFIKGQARYSKFRTEFDAVNRKFDVWAKNIETGKGERSLRKIFTSNEMRKIADVVTRETGITLTSDKILSILDMIARNPAIRGVAVAGGAIGGLIYLINNMAEGGGSSGQTGGYGG